MKKKNLLLLFCLCLIWSGSAQDIPEGLRVLLDNFFTDSTMRLGFYRLKDYKLLDSSLKSQDMKIGHPIEVYLLDNENLRDLPDSMPVKAFLKPANKWEIPLYIKGSCIRFNTAYFGNQSWYFGSTECCGMANSWNKLRKIWPENKGINPMIIEWGVMKMLHFPQKNNHNLTFLPGWDLISNLDSTDKDVAVIGDSRRIFPKLKEFWRNNEKEKAEHPERDQDYLDRSIGGDYEKK